MSLLTLKDIGKIYVSDGGVAVGIRGVNLSFDKGEFVAVTGKSGSGKSTLLNVISGMDSYEEGELFIEGAPTSHYLQPEWEEYREKYISFIFQDYNIIESFTVLENVELALMHIEDKRQRRKCALELIDKVGLTSHIKHKGSKLSGGQKQRTVIARALAKDSPIILADEPTGNLDSATSKEIIELLREVSRDKLLIVVTHNFEEVEDYATRHVRIFDGAVDFDHRIAEPCQSTDEPSPSDTVTSKKNGRLGKDIKNGITLGGAIFRAKPKLSFFLCMLMFIGALGIFIITSFCGSATSAFRSPTMFRHIDGRAVITTRDGSVLTEDQLAELCKNHGALDYLRYDYLLDQSYASPAWVLIDGEHENIDLVYTYSEDFGDNIIGSYPKAENEALLYLPISYQPAFGKDEILIDKVLAGTFQIKISGIKYFYDNNESAKCLLTEDGFRTATAAFYLLQNGFLNVVANVSTPDGQVKRYSIYSVIPSFDMEEEAASVYVDDPSFLQAMEAIGATADISFSASYYSYDYFIGSDGKQMVFTRSFDGEELAQTKPPVSDIAENWYGGSALIISDDVLCDIAEEVLSLSYKQASIFFANDKAAAEACASIKDLGYVAVPSFTTYEPDAFEILLGLFGAIAMVGVWMLAIVFLAFFIGLCSKGTLDAFKSDMAIMRSMGIPVRVIRIGILVRMTVALIPAFVALLGLAIFIFANPHTNQYFTYLYPWQYGVIFLGMLILTLRVTLSQIKRLFGTSVKRALKGGAAQ